MCCGGLEDWALYSHSGPLCNAIAVVLTIYKPIMRLGKLSRPDESAKFAVVLLPPFLLLVDAACVGCRDEEKGVIMSTSRQKKAARLPDNPNQFLMRMPRQPAMPARNRMPARVWVELALGLMSSALLALALLSPHWMELLFGRAPDAGDGSAERGVALLWSALSVLMFGLAGRTWRRQIRSSSINLALER